MKHWLPFLAIALPVLGCQAIAQNSDDPSAAFVGKPARSLALKSTDGKSVDPGKRFGKQPVVMVFYRGVW